MRCLLLEIFRPAVPLKFSDRSRLAETLGPRVGGQGDLSVGKRRGCLLDAPFGDGELACVVDKVGCSLNVQVAAKMF